MNNRVWIYLIGIFFAMAFQLPGPGLVAQESDPTVAAKTTNQRQAVVFRLQNRAAGDVADALLALLKNDLGAKATIVPDLHSNSLIMSGTREQVERTKEILTLIDQAIKTEAKQEEKRFLQQYALSFVDAQDATKILSTMFAGEADWRVDVDERRNVIISYGPESLQEKIGDTLRSLDVEPVETESSVSSVYLHMTLVVEGSQIDENAVGALKDPTDQIAELLREAKRRELMQFDNPKTAISSVTRVRCQQIQNSVANTQRKATNISGGRFENGSQNDATGFFFKGAGYLTQMASNSFHLDATVSLGIPVGKGQAASADMKSEIVAPIDHSVVLSFSTIGGVDSAVIIQIRSAD